MKSIIAIDFSPEMFQIAQNKVDKKGIKNVKFLIQHSNHLNYEDNSFDVILIINLLQAVPKLEDTINEVKKID